MRIVVDKMPESVDECMFSEHKTTRDGRHLNACKIHTYHEKLGHKASCVCNSVSNCNVLVELKNVQED
jgi:hypothetical protein